MKETSYGIVPFSFQDNAWKVFLVQHQKGHWSLPKGHLEKGEEPIETATRELKEETGLDIDAFLSYTPYYEQYAFQRGSVFVQKKVGYFPARVKGDVVIQEKELQTGEWCSLDEAKKRLTFPEARAILEKAIELL